MSLAEMKDKTTPLQPFRANGHYGSTVSLKSFTTETTGNTSTDLKCLGYSGGSLISLHDHPEVSQIRRRSPSLPPIFNKEREQYLYQDHQRDFGIEGLQYQSHKLQKQHHRRRSSDRGEVRKENHYASPAEEREGETSGYASDSVDVPVAASERGQLPGFKQSRIEMAEKTWQNPYCTTPESSLPPSRRLSDARIGELNRPRWGSLWGQETARGDPPAPSWLSRLGHTSQVLVINHDSASSPDSSTTGSTGSEMAKTYLRGQNIPVDADILQEREARRQKALELQTAIKQQLEEKDRKRKEEKERRMREERLEEERIKREQEREKERFEEEQRKLKEKETAKLKQAEAMREVLQAAERLAKEEKKSRWKREEIKENNSVDLVRVSEINNQVNNNSHDSNYISVSNEEATNSQNQLQPIEVEKEDKNSEKGDDMNEKSESREDSTKDAKSIQVPISKDVAIVLSGRLENSEALNKANLQLVNLLVSPSPRGFDSSSNNLSLGINAVMRNMASPLLGISSSRISPTTVENRLLTPSKYRVPSGRDFGTQTDIESDLQELREKMQESTLKESSIKDRKDTTNTNRRDAEKSVSVGTGDDSPMKSLTRSKSQPRTSIESRPRWNANRPGTRYRTQSEKDPHYQRRMRLRRRQVESSDERSRSPSPDRRKASNVKSKMRNINRRKVKVDNYDADLSMDSLNSIIPLRIDKDGRINLEDSKCQRNEKVQMSNDCANEVDNDKMNTNDNSNVWCGQEILSKLSSLKNGLLLKQIEWESERCLVSPAASEIY